MSERRENWWEAFDKHKNDPYAHGALIGRLMQENITLRENFENRLRTLERFRAQATLLGGIGLVLLGSLSTVVVAKIWL